jgi:acetyl-CoA/propionyl-CoA carboxylase biotin carboxyl carrier protein
MLAKVIAWGVDRPAALSRLDRALGSYTLLGVQTNLAFLRSLLADPDVQAGRLDTGLAERRGTGPAGTGPAGVAAPAQVLAAAALEGTLALEVPDPGPWEIPDGWRLGGPAWTTGGSPVMTSGSAAWPRPPRCRSTAAIRYRQRPAVTTRA